MTIRKNSKLVKKILANDNLKVEAYNSMVTMENLRKEIERNGRMLSVSEYQKGKLCFHFHSELAYFVTL